MSNYFNGSGTIGFTCDSCGRETQGCTLVNGMKFCAKCYQETFGETDKDKQIADLENKLEQSQKEKELDNSFWKQECDSLQKALAEKEKEIDNLQDKLHHYYEEIMNKGTCGLCDHLRGEYKIDFAIEQLEKVKELCIKDMTICENYFAIEDILDQQINKLKRGK